MCFDDDAEGVDMFELVTTAAAAADLDLVRCNELGVGVDVRHRRRSQLHFVVKVQRRNVILAAQLIMSVSLIKA